MSESEMNPEQDKISILSKLPPLITLDNLKTYFLNILRQQGDEVDPREAYENADLFLAACLKSKLITDNKDGTYANTNSSKDVTFIGENMPGSSGYGTDDVDIKPVHF